MPGWIFLRLVSNQPVVIAARSCMMTTNNQRDSRGSAAKYCLLCRNTCLTFVLVWLLWCRPGQWRWATGHRWPGGRRAGHYVCRVAAAWPLDCTHHCTNLSLNKCFHSATTVDWCVTRYASVDSLVARHSQEFVPFMRLITLRFTIDVLVSNPWCHVTFARSGNHISAIFAEFHCFVVVAVVVS